MKKHSTTATLSLCLLILSGCAKELDQVKPSKIGVEQTNNYETDNGQLVLIPMGNGIIKLENSYQWTIGTPLLGLDPAIYSNSILMTLTRYQINPAGNRSATWKATVSPAPPVQISYASSWTDYSEATPIVWTSNTTTTTAGSVTLVLHSKK